MLIDANTCFGLSATSQLDYSLETLLGLLDRHGVDRALTHSLRGVDYDFVSGNEETLQASRQHPQLIPVATIDPRRHLGCREEVRRCAEAGFAAFRFFPDKQGWPIIFQPFLDLCELIAQAGLPVILPAGGNGQQTLIAERLALLGLRVLLIGAGYSTNAETAAVLARYAGFYTESHVYDTPGTLETVGEFGGYDRLVFGSGLPDRNFGAARQMGLAADFTERRRSDFFAGNVLRFLGEGGQDA